jgi:YVTN family beta-propeller protein
MNFKKVILLAFVSTLFFASCSKDDDPVVEAPLGAYDNGVLILNQGNFGGANASMSYLSDDFVTFQNDVFHVVNPTIVLGDVAQDIGFHDNLAFIVLNNSNKIEVVNRYTLVHVATISTGLSNPRYIAFANGKGYVTNWGNGGVATDDFVAVINLSTYSVSSTIPVVEGPERLVVNDNKLYIANAGGYNFGNTISVINMATNAVSSITVGDVPNSLEVSNGNLFVVCGGVPSWGGTETAGKLVKINLATNMVTSTLNFATATHPANLDIENNDLFYTVDSDVYKSTITATTLPAAAMFSTTPQGVFGIYSFAVRNNKIYVGDAGNYSANGKVYTYSATGALEHSYTVGIIPAGFYFN